MDLLLTDSLSLLCNLCLLYFFPPPAFPYSHFLPLSPSHPSFLLLQLSLLAPVATPSPLPLPRLLRLYNLCRAAAGAHTPSSQTSLSQSSAAAVRRKSGGSWDYPTHLPRDKRTHGVIHVCVCETPKLRVRVCVLFYSDLCSLESSTVINLPLFQKSCDLSALPLNPAHWALHRRSYAALIALQLSLHITGLFSEL